MRYRAIRLVAANLFNTSTIRLIASFSLMGTVFAGVAFGMTEYGDTARLIGAAIGGGSTVVYNIWKTTKQLSAQSENHAAGAPESHSRCKLP